MARLHDVRSGEEVGSSEEYRSEASHEEVKEVRPCAIRSFSPPRAASEFGTGLSETHVEIHEEKNGKKLGVTPSEGDRRGSPGPDSSPPAPV